jgi:hypothetical protein
MGYYQHNKTTVVTTETYKYVYMYKKQLLQNVTTMLNKINVKFVISHGNLIEFARNKPIYHDDDLDIRFDINDMPKWQRFCDANCNHLTKYNICFDNRFKYIDKQKYNGIQCRLIKFHNIDNITEYSKMDIHCDLIASVVGINKHKPIWPPCNINFDKRMIINYLGVNTFAPNHSDTHMILSKQYGPHYIIPLK